MWIKRTKKEVDWGFEEEEDSSSTWIFFFHISLPPLETRDLET